MAEHLANRRYLLHESLLLLGVSLFLLLGGTTGGLVDQGRLIFLGGLLSAVAVAWIIAGQDAPTPLGLPLVGWIIVYALATALSSDPRRSLSQMGLMAVSIFLFALFADLAARGWQAELVVKVLLVVGAILNGMGWLEFGLWYSAWIGAGGGWSPASYRPASANMVAAFLNLTLLLALARLLLARSRSSQILTGLLALSSLALLYLTSSRAGWMGSAAGIFCLGVLLLRRSPGLPRAAWTWLRCQPLAAGVLITLVLAGLIVAGALVYRQALHPSHASSIFAARSEFWGPAWQAFLSSPLTGTGPFTFASAYLAANSVPPRFLFVHSHGTPLNLLAEMGLLGAAALGWLVFAAASTLWRVLSKAQAADWGVAAGAAACLVALGVQGFFDCFHTEPITLWAFVIVLGAALGSPQAKTALYRAKWFSLRRPLWAGLLAGVVWLEIWLTAPLYQGVRFADQGDWTQALPALQEAYRRDPASTIASQQAGLAASLLAGQENVGGLEKVALARQYFEQAARLDPAWAFNLANLGALQLAEGNAPGALRSFERAVRAAPGCAPCWLNLGAAAESLDDTTAARAAYRQALTLQPSWVEAYFWRSTPLRRESAAIWRAAHPAIPPATLAGLEAQAQANSSRMAPLVRLASATLAAGDEAQAAKWLARAVLAYSDEPADLLDLRWTQAELAARQGRLEQAIELGESAVNGQLAQGVNGAGSFGALYYAPLAFRRPAMAQEIVPQLTLIRLDDTWGSRLEILIGWARQAGKPELAEKWRVELLHAIPDYPIK
ncbi:MAG TPA: O-antigen ligase family protein [Anaerolineaceae bacterium]